jgi:truncated hemoglobin YjbI
MYRDDEEVSEVVHRHLKNRLPDLIGEKKSVTFRMDLYDHARLEWLTENLGVSKSVLLRDLVASAMAAAMKELVPDDEARKELYEQFREHARELLDSGEGEG